MSSSINNNRKQSKLFFAGSDTTNIVNSLIHSLPFEQRIKSLAGISSSYQPAQQQQQKPSDDKFTTKTTKDGQLILHHNPTRRSRENEAGNNNNNAFTSIADVLSNNNNSINDDENDDDDEHTTKINIDINPEELKAKSNQQKHKLETENSNGAASNHNNTKNENLKFKVFRKVASEGGLNGKVTALAVDPGNTWFATGSADGAVRAFDLASGNSKLTFASRHIGAVRSMAISSLSPYLFTAGEDKLVKCWDLERNEIIREYHGHLSAVYTVNTHPRQDIIVSGGRDASLRVWDVRSRNPIHILSGAGSSSSGGSGLCHSDSVLCCATQESTPQLVSGGADGLIFLWDLGTGRPITRLTRHKKPVRSLMLHPTENTMVSVGADAIRKWRVPIGEFMGNLTGSSLLQNLTENNITSSSHQQDIANTSNNRLFDTVWNTASYSPLHDCFVVGSESGNLLFADWQSMKVFYKTKTKSTSKETTVGGSSSVICSSFDRSGDYLLTGEGDKSISHWKSVIKSKKEKEEDD